MSVERALLHHVERSCFKGAVCRWRTSMDITDREHTQSTGKHADGLACRQVRIAMTLELIYTN